MNPYRFVNEGCSYDAGSNTSAVSTERIKFGDIAILNSQSRTIVELISLGKDGCKVIDGDRETILQPTETQTFSNFMGTIKVTADSGMHIRGEDGAVVA